MELQNCWTIEIFQDKLKLTLKSWYRIENLFVSSIIQVKENQIMSRDVESGYIESELSSSKDSFEIELEELNNDPNKPTH